MAAHYGLGRAYGTSPWGANKLAEFIPAAAAGASDSETPVEAEAVVKLAAQVADAKAPAAIRQAGAVRLARDIAQFADGPRPRFQSRLEPLHEIVAILGPAWDAEIDNTTLIALGHALEVAHVRLQMRLRPDETAEGRAFAKARQKDPAANHNAQSIVIHSLNRPGDAGIDAPIEAAATEPIRKSTPRRASGAEPRKTPEKSHDEPRLRHPLHQVPRLGDSFVLPGCNPGTATPVVPPPVARCGRNSPRPKRCRQ